MEVQITHNDVNITSFVLNYQRTKEICSGIETFDMEISKNIPYNMIPWDRIKIFEEGSHRSTLRISSRNQSSRGTYKLSGQDESKRLTDYFVSDNYYIDYPSTARYWIEKFMAEANVSYIFETSSNGALISEGTNMGLNHAYDIIQLLLQQSGWYMKFDENRVAHVGELNLSLSDFDERFTDDEILNIEINQSDKLLRNRAIVWGKGDPTTGEWIYADLSVNTPWNYDVYDQRAVVLANSYINSQGVAYSLAQQMLNEFTQLLDVVTIEVHGGYDLDIGSVINIDSDYYKGTGFITTYSARADKDGLVTSITINERCPRLFGYYGFSGDYVYIGTTEHGVYRKLLEGSTWEAFNAGLSSLYVTDLKISGGVFACVAGGELYIRNTGDTVWNVIDPGTFHDTSESPIVDYISSVMECMGCTINRVGNTISAIYRTIDLTSKRSWAVKFNPDGSNTKYLLNNDIDYNAIALDLDTDDANLYATIRTTLTEVEAVSDCTEKFSTLNLEEPSREYSRSVSGPDGDSNFRGYSAVERCEFKSYFLEYDYVNDQARVIIVDHSNADTLLVTEASYFDLKGGSLTNLIYYKTNIGALWFVAFVDGAYHEYNYQPLFDNYVDLGTTTVPAGDQYKNLVRVSDHSVYNVESGITRTVSTSIASTKYQVGNSPTYISKGGYRITGNGTSVMGIYAEAETKDLSTGDTYSSSTLVAEFLDLSGVTKYYEHDGAVAGPGVDYNTESTFSYVFSILVRAESPGSTNFYEVGGYTTAGPLGSVAGVANFDATLYSSDHENSHGQFYNHSNYCPVLGSLGGTYSVYDLTGDQIGEIGLGNIQGRFLHKMDYYYDFAYALYVSGGFTQTRQAYLRISNLGDTPATTDMHLFNIPSFNNYSFLFNIQARGHILSTAYTTRNTNNDSVNSTLRIFEFFQEGGVTPGFQTVQLTSETEPHWTVIDETTQGHFLEISQSFPVASFAYTNDADNLRIGTIPSGFISPVGDQYHPLISDIRVFDLTPQSSIPTESGPVTVSGGRYIGICVDNTAKFIPYDLSGNFTLLTTVSGGERPRMETSNFFQPPYFFVAASGVFLQKDPNGSTFINYSTGMPSSTVTVVRIDDLL